MTPATKAKAQEKLAAVVTKVGYPDRWKDYSALQIGRDSWCENMMNASRWSFRDNLSKFGKPVDRLEWGMTPQTYNAYYNPSNNEIVMPAAAFAIPGMKDEDIDEALIYGNAGAGWVGHEITHGFDDEGRHFDAKGNLVDWWTKKDAAQFDLQAKKMVDQFNAYEPIPSVHINGKAALGENIADYGGILLGIDAFKQTKTYKSGKKIAGMTPMQRYFLAYNLGWLHQERVQSLRRHLLSDVHAPAKWRVNGPLSNIPEFYRAFGIRPGQPMWRPASKRPQIW
jgi:putative endopeptidase